MFVHLLWFCSTPDEPHGQEGWPFPVQYSRSPYWCGTETESGNRSLFFQTHYIFKKYPS